MDTLFEWFDTTQQWLFEALFQPMLFALGGGHLLEQGYAAAGWFLVGVLQLVVMVAVLVPLQRWKPVEPVTDLRAIRVDILYTLLHRLGVFRVVMFFVMTPLTDAMFGQLRSWGVSTWHLDALWPGVTDTPWVSLVLYLLVFDFVDYWIHRGQHHFAWWWGLHSLHHSQRQMTLWSDNRNHLLDDVLRDLILVVVAQAIGVAPAQFVAIVAITQLSESFQHANVRLSFGKWGERLWVSPRFHRLHHTIGIGHESNKPANVGKAVLGGHNFGVLLPWWDVLFRTANFEMRYDPTGVRDQVEPDAQGRLRDYGNGFWAQQWRGVLRLFGGA
jgi:sterol desaturase/sphingolipid hydroxylase (fatty acid hydroxylase superfamily)